MKILKLFLISGCFFLFLSECKKDRLSSKNNSVSPNDFLSDDRYKKLVVEIQYVNGYQPEPSTINNFVSFLSQRLNKPNDIVINQHSISSPGKSFYTLEDIKNIEKSNRTENTKRSTLTAYIFIANGDYAGNSGSSKILGIN